MRAGFLTVDITPACAIPLAGYAARKNPFARVDSPLEANLVVLADGDGIPVVLGSLDTLFIGETTVEAIAAEAGIPRSRLLLVSTHTHNAPSLAPEVPRLGRHDAAYGEMVIRRVGGAIRQLAGGWTNSVSVGHARQAAPFNINRRRPAWMLDYGALRRERRWRFGKSIALAPHRAGPIERTLQSIVMRDGLGRIRAILWSFPCHPAFYPFPDHVSADFPGTVRAHLRETLGTTCPVIYLPGLAGSAIPDISFPVPRSFGDLIRIALPFNPILPWFTPATYRAWTGRIGAAATACVHAARPTRSEEMVIHRSARSSPVFVTRPPGGRPDIALDVMRLDFGDACGIVAMTGEMIGEWAPRLPSLLSERRIATGYLAGPCLYFPTDGAVQEGGYEADRFRDLFDLNGNFAADLDRSVLHAISCLFSGAGHS